MAKIDFEPEDLKPLIREVIREMDDDHMERYRLGYPEAEAADLLGLNKWQLRDRRLAGEVKAAKVGKMWLYTRQSLLRLLDEREQLI